VDINITSPHSGGAWRKEENVLQMLLILAAQNTPNLNALQKRKLMRGELLGDENEKATVSEKHTGDKATVPQSFILHSPPPRLRVGRGAYDEDDDDEDDDDDDDEDRCE
jgi:hypothetical protein